MVSIGLVYSINDSTEVTIQKVIDASQRMLKVNSQGAGEEAVGGAEVAEQEAEGEEEEKHHKK